MLQAQLLPCTNSDYNQIASAITEFNLRHLPKGAGDNTQSIGFVLKDTTGYVLGGTAGKIILGSCLSIDILWVEPKYRKQGLATQLIHALEDAARGFKSKLSVVDTFEFQALGFYEKLGYTVFGILNDCPCEGNIRYYLQKKL